MTADEDYVKQLKLVREYIKLDTTRVDARASIFYYHLEGMFNYEVLGSNYKQSNIMRDLRMRFVKGRGQQGEPVKMYDYFSRKFSKEITYRRELMKDEKVKDTWWYK